MGVSGSGKTTIGKLLANALALPFYDADDFHPAANISKMKNGIPLVDEDRFPWLAELASQINSWQKTKGAVLACSALKESYRAQLKNNNQLEFIYLNGSFDTIYKRMQERNHFMAPDMLQSQFDTLEVPSYGIHVVIDQQPETIVAEIMEQLNTQQLADIGVFGIGVMGKSLALNMLDKGFNVSVCNREEENLIPKFLEAHQDKSVQGFTDLEAFVASLSRPRKILLMVKAGKVVDLVINQLKPFLEKGDIIIDGGNSFYLSTSRRSEDLHSKGIQFIGAGVSGGEKGALLGPSIMPGGSETAYEHVKPILEAIAAKDNKGKPCCVRIGQVETGHFVKMIHNGIEYAEMQLLAEAYSLLKAAKPHEEIIAIFKQWQKTDVSSFLLDATIKVLEKKEGDTFVIDTILDKAGNKGTGAWSSIESFKLGISSAMMSAAVMARYDSSQKAARVAFANRLARSANNTIALEEAQLFSAYRVARIINHHQGFEILRTASEQYNWNLNLSEISRIWTNGCIIKSTFMESCVPLLKDNQTLLHDDALFRLVTKSFSATKDVLKAAIDTEIAIPCFSAAYQYIVAMTSEKLSANIIQGQRDFFGAHTYQKLNDPTGAFYHTNWEE